MFFNIFVWRSSNLITSRIGSRHVTFHQHILWPSTSLQIRYWSIPKGFVGSSPPIDCAAFEMRRWCVSGSTDEKGSTSFSQIDKLNCRTFITIIVNVTNKRFRVSENILLDNWSHSCCNPTISLIRCHFFFIASELIDFVNIVCQLYYFLHWKSVLKLQL